MRPPKRMCNSDCIGTFSLDAFTDHVVFLLFIFNLQQNFEASLLCLHSSCFIEPRFVGFRLYQCCCHTETSDRDISVIFFRLLFLGQVGKMKTIALCWHQLVLCVKCSYDHPQYRKIPMEKGTCGVHRDRPLCSLHFPHHAWQT